MYRFYRTFCIFPLLFMPACTYNISMAHTEGEASDVIDDTQAPSTTISPDVSIPVSAVPK